MGDSFVSPLTGETFTDYGRLFLHTAWLDTTDPVDVRYVGLRNGDGHLNRYLATSSANKDGIMGCPMVKKGLTVETWEFPPGVMKKYMTFQGSSYQINRQPLVNFERNKIHQFSNIKRPSELIFMAEGLGSHYRIISPSEVPDEPGLVPEPRHSGKFNGAFLDGHVESGTLNQLYIPQFFDRN